MRFEGVGSFSIVKWAPFQLSKFGKCARSGPLFDCQMGSFSVDKNKFLRILISLFCLFPALWLLSSSLSQTGGEPDQT